MKLIIAGTRPPDYILKNVKKYAEWMVRLYNLCVYDGGDDGLRPGLMVTRWSKGKTIRTAFHPTADLKFESVDEIDNGDAYGGDHLGVIIGNNYCIKVETFKADWKANLKAAGMIRNREMAEHADELYLAWDGKSSGSRNMKEEMIKREKPVHELVIKDWTLGVK